MCTLALYFQQFSEFPLVVAANRDEHFNRPSGSPQVLADKPWVFGGKDLLAGGTWLGVNSNGMLVGILNRRSGVNQEGAGVKSRGLLCLEVLRANAPKEAVEILRREKATAYRPFNLLFANATEAVVAFNTETDIDCVTLDKGLHVLSNTSIYDPPADKADNAHGLFTEAVEQINQGDRSSFVSSFKGILSNHRAHGTRGSKDAICVHSENYGTVSSTIIFYRDDERQFYYYHAAGPPCRSDYEQYPPVKVM